MYRKTDRYLLIASIKIPESVCYLFKIKSCFLAADIKQIKMSPD